VKSDMCDVQTNDELKTRIEQFLADEPASSADSTTASAADITKAEEDIPVTTQNNA